VPHSYHVIQPQNDLLWLDDKAISSFDMSVECSLLIYASYPSPQHDLTLRAAANLNAFRGGLELYVQKLHSFTKPPSIHLVP
jgi:hypothetical protein